MASVPDGNKAKTARRVIEVLEFFDAQNRRATVMDIVRRYDWPQSSTSELLASLVELGLLYKDPYSRSYTLTPRAALLGSLSQPGIVRNGTLSMLIERLVAQTGLGTILLGMVGLHAQVFCWTQGRRTLENSSGLTGGEQERLCDTPAGWLLLSTLKADRRMGLLRRMNAESPEESRFNINELNQQIVDFGRQGFATGPAGFASNGEMCAILLPDYVDERPLVLGFVYQPGVDIDTDALVALLQRSVQRYVSPYGEEDGLEHPVSTAA